MTSAKRTLATGAALLALLLGVVAFAIVFVRDFSEPFWGAGDTRIWGYTSYYFSKYFHFTPWPHLDLINNEGFYPYGNDHVFHPWSVERDLFCSFAYLWKGPGPWVPIYYLFTITVTAVGGFFLFRNVCGTVRSTVYAALVTFFSFYAILKFPFHMHVCVVHWMTLGMIADHIIFREAIETSYVSPPLVAVRAALLPLAMGQDLGYVAGLSLTSFTLTAIALCWVVAYRVKKSALPVSPAARALMVRWFADAGQHRVFVGVFSAIALAAAWVYVPSVVEVARHVKTHDFRGVPIGPSWSSPLRLFVPLLPGFNPNMAEQRHWFADIPEGVASYSPGYTLLLLGAVGLWQARKSPLSLAPAVVFFLLCLFYNPISFPTLQVFPWSRFSRVGSRAGLVFAPLLVLFATRLRLPKRPSVATLVTGAWAVLALTEAGYVYSLPPPGRPGGPSPELSAHLEDIRVRPGEAILSWPFCVTSGNAVGSIQGVCPYPGTGTSFSMSQFHRKKVVGVYYGRLAPDQIEPFLAAGWQHLFAPNAPGFQAPTKQTRCFFRHEWAFFEDFYKHGDFAGIQLFRDFLPTRCIEAFHQRFGQPSSAANEPFDNGDLEFIPKSPSLRAAVDVERARKLRLETPAEESLEYDFIAGDPVDVHVDGIAAPASYAKGAEPRRWAMGSAPHVDFHTRTGPWVTLRYDVYSPAPGQQFDVVLNGAVLHSSGPLSRDQRVRGRHELRTNAGDNVLAFVFRCTNASPECAFAAADSRPLTVEFSEFILTTEE